MAKKFFNQRVNNTKKTITHLIIISVCIVGIIICFMVAKSFRNKPNKDAVIEIRDSVFIEINTDYPEKTSFFSKLENVSEDDIDVSFSEVNLEKIGDYEVLIKIKNKKYKSVISIVDTFGPEIKTKDLKIEENAVYTANDFVESCTDNSNEDCNIDFYTFAMNQDGKPIDFSQYKKSGTYKIQIVASDSSDNTTLADATLIVGDGTDKTPICKFGDNKYDNEKFTLAVDVTNNGCAVDSALYQDKTILAPVEKLMENETIKLKKEFSKLGIKDGTISLKRNAVAIWNESGKGIVGYTLQMEVSMNNNGNSEIIESYYLDQTGKRIYSTNKYNLE